MGSFKHILVLVVIFGCAICGAAQNRYVVYFADKNSSTYKISEPEKFLSSRSIARRVKQEIAVTEADIPVNASYVQQLATAGAEVYYTSRWLNCALVGATTEVAASLRLLAFVNNVEYVAPGGLSSARMKSVKARKQTSSAEATQRQLEMLGIDDMQSEKILGEGVLVAIMDAGFLGVDSAEPFKHLFTGQKINYVYDFVHKSQEVYHYDDHGTEVFSIIAANSDAFTGGAYNASFQLYVTEDAGEYRVEEYNWLFAAERADSCGVDVITTSLGYSTFDDSDMDYNKATDLNGKIAIISKAAAAAIERGIVVVTSAGNEGNNSWGTITPPADVDGVIAVGAVTSQLAKSPFSSTGPTSDNRIKPDVVALGSGVSVVKPNGANGFASGTSLSAPIVTSLVIGLIEKFPDVDPNTIAQQVILTASYADHPGNVFGYGIPNYNSVKASLESAQQIEPFSVYPNPTDTGTFFVRFKNTGVEVAITVYDMNGHIVRATTVNVTSVNNPIEINMIDLPASSYLVKVKTSDNFKAFRLVKL